ncbi:MAG: hypothetical protein MUP85_19750 [Candidatus Lokiarchaeota archaeon]|nr:hypothetical protein [Candidatus Lokiarchaeota archaeon]
MIHTNISEEMRENIMNHFGYSKDELNSFLENPCNQEILSKSLKMLGKSLVAEVVESNGCNSQHKVGDKFYFDGAGNLLTKLSPKKICIYALAELDKLIFAADELLLAGVNPNKMHFKRVSCFDVGVKCGGWGQIVIELKVIERK